MVLLAIKEKTLEQKYENASMLLDSLSYGKNFEQKLEILKEHVEPFIQNFPKGYLSLDAEGKYLTQLMYALGQGDVLYQEGLAETAYRKLTQDLIITERFYASIGGMLGYYHTFLAHVLSKDEVKKDIEYSEPPGIDISKADSKEVNQLIASGINAFPKLGEVYPIGGAGDRFNLIDHETGTPLPVACLTFNGFNLLEGLFRDLAAREYLYYKLHGVELLTPCVIMTSAEKGNHEKVKAICKKNHYFGRGEAKIILLKQPLAPVITKDGDLSQKEAGVLNLKPGGHGVLWRVCEQGKAFEWFKAHQRSKVLVRQINNPIAGVDYGLLAFTGKGMQDDAQFGFSSCHRHVGAAEGVNVYYREGDVHGISNVEYTEFENCGIEDKVSSGGDYSKYPANTNILFADIEAILSAVKKNPIPGKIINMKHKVSYIDADGERMMIQGGRLESIMQNIADDLSVPNTLPLRTYVTYNYRSKTISSTKSPYKKGGSLDGTPHGAYYTYWKDLYYLLMHRCLFELPKEPDQDSYLKDGPSFYARYLPALGPTHHVIAQKIQKGFFHEKSSLVLEVSELDMQDLHLKGALHIAAENPLGKMNSQDCLVFGEEWSGKCTLKNIKVVNKGLDQHFWDNAWEGRVHYQESLTIEIEGNGEFYAENVTFLGDQRIKVPSGVKVVAKEVSGKVVFEEEALENGPSWKWEYKYSDSQAISLQRKNLN